MSAIADHSCSKTAGSVMITSDTFLDRYSNATLGGDLLSAVVACVGVPDHSHAGIVGQDPGQLLGSQFATVGKRDLTGVDRAADANPAAVVNGHPGCTGSG